MNTILNKNLIYYYCQILDEYRDFKQRISIRDPLNKEYHDRFQTSETLK